MTVVIDQTAASSGIFTKRDSLILNFRFIPHSGIENSRDKIPNGTSQNMTFSESKKNSYTAMKVIRVKTNCSVDDILRSR